MDIPFFRSRIGAHFSFVSMIFIFADPRKSVILTVTIFFLLSFVLFESIANICPQIMTFPDS